MADQARCIGIISTRLAGTDGVSLEVRKWVRVLENLGYVCFYLAGESEWPDERSYVVEEAHFEHPEIKKLNVDLFDDYIRSNETSAGIERLKNHLKVHIYAFIRKFSLDMLIIENAMAIPMNVPLGLALTEVIAETRIPTIAHHHDFAWERPRFSVSAADDYLNAAFPATLNSITHVVINSYGQSQLALRTGASSVVVPNVMDFDSPPPEPDGYADDLHDVLGIEADEFCLLQPTRIVPRKRIERAIGLAKRLDLPSTVVISHGSGDEGQDYRDFLEEFIRLFDVKVCFAEEIFGGERGMTTDGRKIYSLRDAYQASDLVTYPSTIEGFGNAFLEALYFKRPLVMSTYEIYRIDIQPKGFNIIEFGDYITEDTVHKTRQILLNPELSADLCEQNYEIARHHYSYSNLEKLLAAIISFLVGD
ncbi:MAG: glycosyltransferase family 4 protein [Anaerolineales bacterium]|jgi:glycosyltransferase involved in cell wall biosynthesis